KMQNSELSSKSLNKKDSYRNVITFQANLTLCKGLDEAPEGQAKTRILKLLGYKTQLLSTVSCSLFSGALFNANW
ncbi:hypothetical protein, partial [Vibrio gangliei]|uniref:hypothetical protein n=1 Tax=Vibrio gangliei TaxID=2077090 RepID=UPI001B808583